jgi:hypothetical protein
MLFKRERSAALISFILATAPLAAQVHFEKRSDRVLIQIEGKPFSALHFGKEEHKPFLHPLLTPSGKSVLRGFPVKPSPGDATDRPHQRGCWIGAEHLNGEDFWENDPLYKEERKGTILFKQLSQMKDGADRGTLSLVADWISHGGEVWLVENRKMTFYSKVPNCRMFDVEIELEAKQDVTFEDQQDAIIGMRLALPFDDHYGGRVINSEGAAGEDGTRGRRAAWLDWTADLDPKEYGESPHGIGEKIGVALFDHPSNLNYPTRWQVRSFGDFSANPFAEKIFQQFDTTATKPGDYRMKRGDTLHLRYRVLIHPGQLKVDDFYKGFTSQ